MCSASSPSSQALEGLEGDRLKRKAAAELCSLTLELHFPVRIALADRNPWDLLGGPQ